VQATQCPTDVTSNKPTVKRIKEGHDAKLERGVSEEGHCSTSWTAEKAQRVSHIEYSSQPILYELFYITSYFTYNEMQ